MSSLRPTADVLLRVIDQCSFVQIEEDATVLDLKYTLEETNGIFAEDQLLSCQGRALEDVDLLYPIALASGCIDIRVRLLGGKGGFGSLLKTVRGPGKKVQMNNNACRTLDGRRVRHRDQEKKIQEWKDNGNKPVEPTEGKMGYLARKRKRQEEEAKQALELAKARHEKERAATMMTLDKFAVLSKSTSTATAEATEEGIARALMSAADTTAPPAKRRKIWDPSLDMPAGSASDSDDDDDDADVAAAIEASLVPAPASSPSKRAGPAAADEHSDVDDESTAVAHAAAHAADEAPRAIATVAATTTSISTATTTTTPAAAAAAGASASSAPIAAVAVAEEAVPSAFPELKLADFANVAALVALGADHLKAELTRLGLKAGGTAEQRAERLFSVRNLDRSEWPKKHLAPAKPQA